MEPTSTAIAVIGGKLTYDLARDVLGPTAKYLGEELKGLTEIGVTNIKRVFENAQKRNLDSGKTGGSVPPRLLYPLLQSAYFCEDELVASYLGGVLSSSRVDVARDDRSIGIVKMIDGLSSYALRLHCIIYSSVIHFPKQSPQSMRKWLNDGHGVSVLLDEESLRQKMDFKIGEDADEILEHAFLSLSAHDLSSEGFRRFELCGENRNARSFRLSLRGVELYCWGNGFSHGGSESYFAGEVVNRETPNLTVEPIAIQLGMVSWK